MDTTILGMEQNTQDEINDFKRSGHNTNLEIYQHIH